jgi:hypothetical protein
MKKLLITSVIMLCAAALTAQGEIDEQQKVFFRNERSFALLLNSDGFGINYREAKRINYLNKRLLELDLGTLKHPKEYRVSNPYAQTAGSFIFGKLNSVLYLRGGIGYQHEIFEKADIGGVAIRYFVAGGPVLSLYKPIFYKVLYLVQGTNYYEVKEEKFEESFHTPYDIYSRAPFTRGLDEIKALPGLYTRGGFNFEYSRQDKVIHAIEIGAQVNAFPKKIPIMASPDNKAVYLSLFVSYRIGVIVDPLHPEETNFMNLFRRKKSL